VPTLLGTPDKQSPHSFLYWEFFEGVPRFAVRRGPWKAIFFRPRTGKPTAGAGTPRVELYNLDADPGESNDLAVQHREVVAELRSLASGTRVRSDHPAWNFDE
jgi:hypothetical protein